MNFILAGIDFFSATRRIKRSGLLIIFFLFVASVQTFATHLRAGNILVSRVGCSLNVTVTIIVYTKDTGNPSDVLFGGDGVVVDFGDESPPAPVPIQSNIAIDLSRQLAYAYYQVEHSYSGIGMYTISYREPNRNGGVVNMFDSEHTEFYLETTINLTYCNQPVTLSVPPIDRGCKGVKWSHNPGAFDPEGVDSLSYQLVVPFQDRGLPVAGYQDPNAPKFYTNPLNGNEAGGQKPSFSINARDGTITWDAPGATGEYNIAFVVIEYKKVNGHWREVTRIRRDMQILIEDCNDKRPDLTVPKDTCVEAGTILKAKVVGFDKDTPEANVELEAFSEVFASNPILSSATFSLNGDTTYRRHPTFQPSPLSVDFEWKIDCARVRARPYQVVFKVTEETQQRLASFKTWSIKVVGPAPKWKDITLKPFRKIALEWKDYFCQNDADSMEIWRRVDSVSFRPDNCQTGMPALGYQLIKKVPMKDRATKNPITSYLDTNGGKGLAPGAMYCYRLVATYPKGGESYVSKDTCIGPIITSAPIITNVTVDTTAQAAGQITVKWHKPLLPPTTSYTYELYRGTGLNGARSASAIASALTDTTYVDKGLDTKETIYNYQVVALDNNVRVDTSAAASSVRLETTSKIKKITLQWNADVPWSNVSQDYPRHKIYRGPAGSYAISQMELIDSVNVLNNGLVYLDSGQYKNTPLKDGIDYCYIVETYGTYGDKKIKAPLRNFSQAVCTQTGDSIPPCKLEPPLRSTLDYIDCDDYFIRFGCHADVGRNIITWNTPKDEDCRDDIFEYEVFWAPNTNGIYLQIAVTRDTFYIHTLNNASFAGCYKIAAVDRSGNVGEMSDPLCIDTCPHYELPNVFSPNGDHCNDTFNAFNDENEDFKPDEHGFVKCPPAENLRDRCPRFVESVIFKVYNRWGKEVYNFIGGSGNGNTDAEKNTIYIDWDGRDNSGIELSTGVYYYLAEVTFTVVDPSQKTKIIKGWVHLVR